MTECLCLRCRAVTPHREDQPTYNYLFWVCAACGNTSDSEVIDEDYEDFAAYTHKGDDDDQT